MLGLIGDLLDQGRIETGTLSVSPEPAEVAGLVDQARSTFLTGGGGHTVAVDLPEDLPRVMADPRRIVQVINNLFSNASRHSPESSPIRVAAARDGLHVAISVSDRGRGVRPDRLPHLFRKHGCRCGRRGGALAQALRPGAVDMQGTGGGARRAHLGGERRGGSRRLLLVHLAGGRGRRRPRPAPRRAAPAGPPTGRSGRASSWSTTTRTPCATFGTRWPRRTTSRS